MKVKSFKLLPGVKHKGVDHETLHNDAPLERPQPEAPTKSTTDETSPEPTNPEIAETSPAETKPAAIETTPLPAVPAPVRPPRRADVDSRKFKDKFVLSVDGERYNPGHGIVVEVHQGLSRFLSDSSLRKYQPSMLHKPVKPETGDAEQENPGSEAARRMSRWMDDMSDQLHDFEILDDEENPDQGD